MNRHVVCVLTFASDIKRVLPSHVSLKTLLVLVHRRLRAPAWRSRPQHCQLQLVANKSVGGRLGNHNLVARCRTDDWAKCDRLRRSNASITMFVHLYKTIRIFLWLLSSTSLAILFVASSSTSALIGSGNFVILVLDVINFPLCTAHTSASPESIQWYIFQSVLLRSCVTASPPG